MIECAKMFLNSGVEWLLVNGLWEAEVLRKNSKLIAFIYFVKSFIFITLSITYSCNIIYIYIYFFFYGCMCIYIYIYIYIIK